VLTSAALGLRVDSWTAEIFAALRERKIEPILLKGPAIARWLYPESPRSRSYVDVDLLVDPARLHDTHETLFGLGFKAQPTELPHGDEPHARPFERPADSAAVDLHRVLHGMEHISPAQVWRVVSRDAVTITVANTPVSIPSEAVRTLHLVLHLSPRDGPGSKAWADLGRGLEIVPLDAWHHAACLARELGIAGEMGHRLSRMPDASSLLVALSLPTRETRLHAATRIAQRGERVPGLVSLLKLAGRTGAQSRLAYLRSKLFPPRAVLHVIYPNAGSGHAALALMRSRRIASCVVGLPRALYGLYDEMRAKGR
jgi:hypothetical protein